MLFDGNAPIESTLQWMLDVSDAGMRGRMFHTPSRCDFTTSFSYLTVLDVVDEVTGCLIFLSSSDVHSMS